MGIDYSSLIPAATGLIGVLFGSLGTFLVQVFRFRHERKLEVAKQTFSVNTTSEERRAEFMRQKWRIEIEALASIKVVVRYVLNKLKSPINQQDSVELYSQLEELQKLSTKVTQHNILLANVDALIRDAKLMITANLNGNTAILGSQEFNKLYNYGKSVFTECERLESIQPDLSRIERLRRAVACITDDFRKRDVFIPEDDTAQGRIEVHFAVLRDEETTDLAFDSDELSAAIESFRRSALFLYDGYDVARSGGITEKDRASHLNALQTAAKKIRKITSL